MPISPCLSNDSTTVTHASSQHQETTTPTPQPTPHPLDEFVFESEDEEDDQDDILSTQEPSPAIVNERPILDRPVQVDALLDHWRAEIRKAGITEEEQYLAAVQEIFSTEKEREGVVAKNMILELNNTVESELISLQNSIIYLAKKGKATEREDPRFVEFIDKIAISRKKIRNQAVEIRYESPKLKIILEII